MTNFLQIIGFAEGSNITIVEIIVRVINYLLGLAAVLAILFIVIGGIRYIISAGNPEHIESAKKTIFNAIVGIIVITLAFVIVNTVVAAIG